MKAIVYTEYGSPAVLQLKEVEKPAPKADEVLVKVQAASINAGDWYSLRGKPFLVRLMGAGLSKPKNMILGADIAGRVEAVGSNVTQFQQGDEVYGDISEDGRGGFAEYVAVPASALALKPGNLTFEQAAAVPLAGVTALQCLRDNARVQAGQKVLISGASGGVGTYAVQIAKSYGADVTAVCSTRNLDLMHAIGADHAIDYTQENFTQKEQRYDLIVAVNGYHPLSDYKRALSPVGRYVCAGGTMPQIFEAMLFGPIMSIGGNKTLGGMGAAQPNQADLIAMTELLEAGDVVPVIDKSYPLSEPRKRFGILAKHMPKAKSSSRWNRITNVNHTSHQPN